MATGGALEEIPVPTPINPNPNVGDPDWFVNVGVRQILERQPVLEKRLRYFEGRHKLPYGDPGYMEAIRKFRKLAPTNYIGLIAGAPVERMQIRGFRFGDASTADQDAQKIWMFNDMDMQSVTIHQWSATYGLAYALVTPNDPDSDDEFPIITAIDPRTAICFKDPMRPTKTIAGFRLWVDDISGKVLAILYLPEGAYGYIGPDVNTLDGLSIHEMADRLTGRGMGLVSGGFVQAGFIANPDGFADIPLIEYTWRPNTGDVPYGECGFDLETIQDRLNQNVYDRIAVSYYAAYPQRWGTGIKTKPTSGRKDSVPESPYQPGVGKVWTVDDPDSSFGQFSSADINQILASIQSDIAQMASISKTPAHYFMGNMSNISGETLTQAESGLVSKTQLRMNTMGWSHVRLMKMCFAFMGDKRAKEPEAATLWMDPQKQLTADLALAGQQWASIGWPLALIMERQGCTPDEIEFAEAEQVKQQAQEQQQMMQQQQMQNTHQQKLAKIAATAPQQPTAQQPPGGPSQAPAKQAGVNHKSAAAKNSAPTNGASSTAKPVTGPTKSAKPKAK